MDGIRTTKWEGRDKSYLVQQKRGGCGEPWSPTPILQVKEEMDAGTKTKWEGNGLLKVTSSIKKQEVEESHECLDYEISWHMKYMDSRRKLEDKVSNIT